MKTRLILFLVFVLCYSQKSYSSDFCGVFKTNKKKLLDSLQIKRNFHLIDRFGNEYLLKDLAFKDSMNRGFAKDIPGLPIPSADPGALPNSTNTCNIGMFSIHFINETATNSKYGFYDSLLGVQRRDVVCQVFRDLSKLLQDPFPNNPYRIHYAILSEKNFSEFITPFPTGAAGLSTGFTVIPTSAHHVVLDNEVQKTAKTGLDSYLGIPLSDLPVWSDGIYHGMIAFRFGGNTLNYQYNASSIPNTEEDFYTTVLHEVLHTLGFSSFVEPMSTTIGAKSIWGSHVYATYDKFLKSNKSLIYYNNTTNQWLGDTTVVLRTGCADTTIKIYFKGNSLIKEDIYAPLCWNGSSLSHLACNDDGCTIGPNICSLYTNIYSPNVMVFCGGKGNDYLRRKPSVNEAKLLCDLGYTLKVSSSGKIEYGEDSTKPIRYKNNYQHCANNICNAIGRDDLFKTPYETPIELTSSAILANDTLAGYIHNLMLLTPEAGSYTFTNSVLKFTPNEGFHGVAIFSYNVGCDTFYYSSLPTYIHIDVTLPDNNCSISKCNLICNGEFEWEDGYADSVYRGLSLRYFIVPPALHDPYQFPNSTLSNIYESNFLIKKDNLFFTYKKRLNQLPNVSYPYTRAYFANPFSLNANFWQQPSTIGGKKYLHMIANKDYILDGGIVSFKLKQPIYKDTCKYQFKILGYNEYTVPLANQVPPPSTSLMFKSSRVVVFGTNKPLGQYPCLNDFKYNQNTSYVCGGDTIKTYYLGMIYFYNYGWNQYTLNLPALSNMASEGINYIVVKPIRGSVAHVRPEFEAYTTGNAIDNIEVVPICKNSLLIKSTLSKLPCLNGNIRVQYKIRKESGKNLATPLKLKLDIPNGFEIRNESMIQSKNFQVTNSQFNGKDTIVLSLDLKMDSSVLVSSATYKISLDFDGIDSNHCVESFSNNDIYVKPSLHNYSIHINTASKDCNLNNSELTLTVVNGFAPYQYRWSNGLPNTGSQNNLPHGIYEVTITDAKGCEKTYKIKHGYYTDLGSLATPPCSTATQAILQGKLGKPTSSPLIGGFAALENQKIRIHGQFIIDTNYHFLDSSELIMTEGSKIVVLPEIEFSLYKSSVKACTKMWQGIEVENNAIVNIAYSDIRDALYAVHFKANASFRIYNSTFANNYVSIYNTPNPSGVLRSIMPLVPLMDNQFRYISSEMKLPFSTLTLLSSNQVLQFPIKPFAAIHLSDCAYMTLGTLNPMPYRMTYPWLAMSLPKPFVPAPANTIDGLMNGIVLFNTDAAIANISFANLTNSEYTPNLLSWTEDRLIKGYGIYAYNDLLANPYGKALLLTGFGKNLPSNSLFTSCSRAVYTHGYNTSIVKGRYINTISAIVNGSAATRGSNYIAENYIEASHVGISQFNVGTNNFSILQNELKITSFVNTNSFTNMDYMASGIRIMEPSDADPTSICAALGTKCDKVADNILYLNGKVSYGIYLSRCYQVGVLNNHCEIISPSTVLGGIYNAAGNAYNIVNNTVISNNASISAYFPGQAGLYPVGIYNFISQGLNHCNAIHTLRTGARYTGACPKSIISRVGFSTNFTGLQIDMNTTIPAQPNRGNYWTGTFNTAARNHNANIPNIGSIIVFNQRFIVSSASPNSMKPWIPPLTVYPASGWFIPITSSMPDQNYCGGNPSGGGGADVSGMDSLIMQDSFVYTEYPIEQAAENAYQLYQELKTQQGVYSSNVLVSEFISTSDTSEIGQYYTLDQELQEAIEPSVTQDALLKTLEANRANILAFMTYLDSLVHTDTATGTQAFCKVQYEQAKTDLMAVENQLNTLETTYKNERNAAVTEVANENETTTPSNVYYEYQQAYNDLYMRTIAIGNYTWSGTDSIELLALAASCPLINADAVFGARNIVTQRLGMRFYDDKYICENAGYSYKKIEEPKKIPATQVLVKNMKVYPNPSNDMVQVAFATALKGNTKLVVSDITGRVVYTKAYNNTITKLELQTQDWNSGYYIVTVLNNNQTIGKEKLYVVH